MAVKNLVIVESPGKIQTISKYLGPDYTVMASFGHVRDLPKNKMSIDVKKHFEPHYIVPKDKKKVVDGLAAKIKKDTVVYIATDEDREGEAIGWHLVQALDLEDRKDLKRIVFHEITKPAILEAIANPRQIDKHLVDAQQARRILDRLVGYELSPLLWKKIKYGLSAGRVQSVAVRLVVEREREILAFKPREYWSLVAEFTPEKGKDSFEAALTKFKGKNFELTNEKGTKEVMDALKGASYTVEAVEKKEVNRNPAAPFTTSTLQQEASRKLGFSVKKTMMLAQHLYEGVELDTGHEGLITYMRTDSVNLSAIALKQAAEVVEKMYGKEYALKEPRLYKGKKGAQEAHEAIRPTDLSRTPEQLKAHLDKDELKLYELIWKRTLACQMAPAIFDQVGADIVAKDYTFRATGQTVRFPGFTAVYTEGKDLGEEDEQDGEKRLPDLKEGEKPKFKKFDPEQHFTKPPARYTEASLVKKLEAEGIGRPSTYAPTISTIQARGYIHSEKKQLSPTEIGILVNDFLVEHFPQILDYQFTVHMEEMLDEIEEGSEKWQSEIADFYGPFHDLVEAKMGSIKKEDVITEKTDEICDLCGKPMMVKFGRFGKFLSCTNFPECKNAKPMGDEAKKEEIPEEERKELEKKYADKKCPKCGKPMLLKSGRFGEYLACEDYPTCKSTESILKVIGVKCPECKQGDLVERHTKKGGKAFYGCNKFPKCKFAVWEKPTSSEHAMELHEEALKKKADKE